MGYGDDIMASAIARVIHEATGRKVAFGLDPSKVYWSEVYRYNPWILQPGEDASAVLVGNCPGYRPYILAVNNRHVVFNRAHRAVPGDLFFSPEEMDWAESVIRSLALPKGFHVVEPNVKGKISAGNKDWGWNKWCAWMDWGGGCAFVQLGPKDTKLLPDVIHVETPTFRHACAILARAAYFWGTDGGLHHAAAALRIPATVVWGGFSHPDCLGYLTHHNVGGGWCGALDDCRHCRDAMEEIRVEDVI